MDCSTINERDWLYQVFPEKCYFYPMRDCPGYERGKRCARIDKIIPEKDDENA